MRLFTFVLLLLVALTQPAPLVAQSSPGQDRPWLPVEDDAAAWPVPVLDSIVARAQNLQPLSSLLMAHGDTLVVEWYAPGQSAREAVNVKSASKTILSALVGLAIRDGYLEGPEQPIGPFFPDILDGTAPEDSVRRSITLGDLMTMRAGLESTSFGNYGSWVSTNNWVRDALERPLVSTPGGRMIYSTGSSHLVAVILEKATGRDLRAYAQEQLFDPLGVQIRAWQEDPLGYRFGGNNLALTPRGLLSFGQLYHRGGWVKSDNGQRRQVIPPDWIGASWNVRVLRTYRGFRYGYFWWFEVFGGEPTFFAWGYGGQMLFIVPSRDLVMVMTSSLSSQADVGDQSGRLMRFCGQINEWLGGED
ncbi:serine hydrolase [Longibacter salinarum]|uniref:Serine hydrolase n=1 Tax=Longibacter salinarum TaxID=1850348 RepID=A0A2A8CUK8_9BACT|nr:serine hydrolase [Longibacter salinarum]PEN11208.1 serine hydrolase [Longibacter salinarum]